MSHLAQLRLSFYSPISQSKTRPFLPSQLSESQPTADRFGVTPFLSVCSLTTCWVSPEAPCVPTPSQSFVCTTNPYEPRPEEPNAFGKLRAAITSRGALSLQCCVLSTPLSLPAAGRGGGGSLCGICVHLFFRSARRRL